MVCQRVADQEQASTNVISLPAATKASDIKAENDRLRAVLKTVSDRLYDTIAADWTAIPGQAAQYTGTLGAFILTAMGT